VLGLSRAGVRVSVRVSSIDKEALMALARVVSFDGVNKDRIEQMKSEMRDGDQPEDVPATEVIVLHDPEADKSLAILFFENDGDYQRADEFLNAMPTGDTPGQRTGVTRYDVAIRMTA
jgi:hypothetical protein